MQWLRAVRSRGVHILTWLCVRNLDYVNHYSTQCIKAPPPRLCIHLLISQYQRTLVRSFPLRRHIYMHPMHHHMSSFIYDCVCVCQHIKTKHAQYVAPTQPPPPRHAVPSRVVSNIIKHSGTVAAEQHHSVVVSRVECAPAYIFVVVFGRIVRVVFFCVYGSVYKAYHPHPYPQSFRVSSSNEIKYSLDWKNMAIDLIIKKK